MKPTTTAADSPGPYHRPAPLTLLTTLATLTLLATLLAGCAGHRPAPTNAPPPGYEALQEQLVGRDLSPLHHRRIVLDPGHGGFFRGAIGPNGLCEADVNLGVALNLQGLLTWAGAEVWLTRTADVDFLSPADSSLSTDLATRVALSDSIQPDVFLSLHHNSTANRDRTINETQTYYPLDDNGASLDLARSIHRHLVINLGIRPASIRPGNFHVLRHATVPAVLGEPAMISHPAMAERLSLAASQRLEAEAYFLGLLDYFQGGLPHWRGAPSDTVFWGTSADPTAITWYFDDTSSSPQAPDLAATTLLLDGSTVTPAISPDARTVTWHIPSLLAPAPHELTLTGRNLAGRATPTRRTILLPRAATTLNLVITVAPATGDLGLHWSGAHGAPVPAGTLRLPGTVPIPITPGQTPWLLHHDPDLLAHPERLGTATFQGMAADAVEVPCRITVRELPPDQQLHLVTLGAHAFAPPHGWRGRLGVQGTTPLVTSQNHEPIWLEGAGVLPLVDTMPGDPAAPRTVVSDDRQWPATPLLAGLAGKTIVLDPTGGGTENDGAGPLGLRGSDLNLAVAQQAARLLRGAGARVMLTRDDETDLLPVEKVRLSGRAGADLFLTIGRRAPDATATVYHHPGSTTGIAWAQAAVQASTLLADPNTGKPTVTGLAESSAYLLRHTACPALEWRFDPPLTITSELSQTQPGWSLAEARAIFIATAAISGHPAVMTHLLDPGAVIRRLQTRGGLPAERVQWAQLDGNFPWIPVADLPTPGLPAFPVPHTLEVHAGDHWQLWLLSAAEPVLLLSGPQSAP